MFAIYAILSFGITGRVIVASDPMTSIRNALVKRSKCHVGPWLRAAEAPETGSVLHLAGEPSSTPECRLVVVPNIPTRVGCLVKTVMRRC